MDLLTLSAALKILAHVTPEAINAWLDDHPEATTTVEDGTISYAKLNTALKDSIDNADALVTANGDGKLQALPEVADSDGTYLITQDDGQMELEEYVVPSSLPDDPESDGNYYLDCTVTSGTGSVTWKPKVFSISLDAFFTMTAQQKVEAFDNAIATMNAGGVVDAYNSGSHFRINDYSSTVINLADYDATNNLLMLYTLTKANDDVTPSYKGYRLTPVS